MKVRRMSWFGNRWKISVFLIAFGEKPTPVDTGIHAVPAALLGRVLQILWIFFSLTWLIEGLKLSNELWKTEFYSSGIRHVYSFRFCFSIPCGNTVCPGNYAPVIHHIDQGVIQPFESIFEGCHLTGLRPAWKRTQAKQREGSVVVTAMQFVGCAWTKPWPWWRLFATCKQ